MQLHVRAIISFAFRRPARFGLSRVSNSSRLEGADAADWLLRVSLISDTFQPSSLRAEHGNIAEAVTCRHDYEGWSIPYTKLCCQIGFQCDSLSRTFLYQIHIKDVEDWTRLDPRPYERRWTDATVIQHLPS